VGEIQALWNVKIILSSSLTYSLPRVVPQRPRFNVQRLATCSPRPHCLLMGTKSRDKLYGSSVRARHDGAQGSRSPRL
jgi:hypothetical protein